jgi:WD40 repeat protein
MSYKAFISYSHAADGKLAPALQTSLQRFAKPWYRLRAIRVFRDKTTLSVTPALWPAIEKAIGESEYFVLLASPEAATSQWVSEEVEYWCRHAPVDKLLLVLTNGEIAWDRSTGDFDWKRTTALPTNLRGVFRQEPMYVDLRWAQTEVHLSLTNPRFRDGVADVGATLYGRPKDELIGEDVRQHRRTVQLTSIAVALLITLTFLATWQAFIANQRQKVAQSRYLAQSSIIEESRDPMLSLLLAREAFRTQESSETLSQLYRTALIPWPRVVYRNHTSPVQRGAVNPKGNRVVTISLNEAHIWAADGSQLNKVEGSFYAVSWSPDGLTLLLASFDGPAFLLNMDGEIVSRVHVPENAWITDAEWSRDSSRLIVVLHPKSGHEASFKHRALVLGNDGKPVAELLGHTKRINRAVWNPVGTTILTASDDGKAIIWDWSGAPLATLSHKHAVYDADWHPNGKVVATASGYSGVPAQGELRIWNADGKLLLNREHAFGTVSRVRWSPDGTRAAIATQDKKVQIWTAQGELVATLRHGYWSTILSWSTDATMRLLTHDIDSVRIWSINGQLLSTIYGLGTGSFPGEAHWSPGRADILITSEDGTAAIWSMKSEFITRVSHDEKVTSAHWSPDRERILTTSEDRTARIWSGTGRLLSTLDHGDTVNEGAWSPDGATIVTVAEDSTVNLWTREGNRLSILKDHSKPALQAKWSPDGSRFVSSSGGYEGPGYKGEAIVWSARGDRLATVHTNGAGILSLAWHPSGKFFVTIDANLSGDGPRGGRAFFWSPGGELIAELTGHTDGAWDCQWSPNGEYLFTASYDHTARIWDKTGKPLRVLKHDWVVSKGAWSPDSTRIATLSWTKEAEAREVRVWKIDGSVEHLFRDPDGKTASVSWSPSGNHLITTSEDGTARIRTPNGVVLGVVNAHTGPARISEWNQDGSLIMTIADDGSVAIWPATPAGIKELIDRRIRRDFNTEERARYGLD